MDCDLDVQDEIKPFLPKSLLDSILLQENEISVSSSLKISNVVNSLHESGWHIETKVIKLEVNRTIMIDTNEIEKVIS